MYMTSKSPDLTFLEDEKYFRDPKSGKDKNPFPSLQDEPSLDLSIVVPAYNEEQRRKQLSNVVMFYFHTLKCLLCYNSCSSACHDE